MAEELPEPERYVPLATVGSILVNGVIGLVYCIVLLFCLGDLTDLLETPTGFPYMQLFLNSTGSQAATTIFTLIIALIATAANSAGLTSTSRTAWAFARDQAFPFSGYFSHISSHSHVPIRMCVLLTLLQALLGAIYVANTTAYNAIISMAILGMYASYVLPIAYMLLFGRSQSSPQRVRFGPFKLGQWGAVINIFAILWGVLAILFSMFPSYQPVNSTNMNYASVVMGAWVFIGAIYYFFYQRHTYNGPLDIVGGEVIGVDSS